MCNTCSADPRAERRGGWERGEIPVRLVDDQRLLGRQRCDRPAERDGAFDRLFDEWGGVDHLSQGRGLAHPTPQFGDALDAIVLFVAVERRAVGSRMCVQHRGNPRQAVEIGAHFAADGRAVSHCLICDRHCRRVAVVLARDPRSNNRTRPPMHGKQLPKHGKQFDDGATPTMDRRHLLKGLGLATATFAGSASGPALAQGAPSDTDILNFALNLEYLEAEFYLRGTTGVGLSDADIQGTGTLGQVFGGRKVPIFNDAIMQYAQEIAADELAHVRFLRRVLGPLAVARPTIDFSQSFSNAAIYAGLINVGQKFDAFENARKFMLGAFIFEDLGVTGYRGAAPLISSKVVLSALAGILAVEAYHAANIRNELFERKIFKETQAISDLRKRLSKADDDQGVVLNGRANIVPTDADGLTFSRTTDQVLNIVYLGGPSAGFGFFPNRLSGSIK